MREYAFVLMKHPTDSDKPEMLTAEIQLPEVKTQREVYLDIGEDRIVLEARKAGYFLDIFVPFSILQSQVKAQFNKESRLLRVKMPLQQ